MSAAAFTFGGEADVNEYSPHLYNNWKVRTGYFLTLIGF
jgi:hypothetical protein